MSFFKADFHSTRVLLLGRISVSNVCSVYFALFTNEVALWSNVDKVFTKTNFITSNIETLHFQDKNACRFHTNNSTKCIFIFENGFINRYAVQLDINKIGQWYSTGLDISRSGTALVRTSAGVNSGTALVRTSAGVVQHWSGHQQEWYSTGQDISRSEKWHSTGQDISRRGTALVRTSAGVESGTALVRTSAGLVQHWSGHQQK